MGKKRGKKQDFIKFSTKVSGVEGGEKAKLYYKGTDYLIGKYREMANYQRKEHVVMSFTHGEKYIVFNDIGKGRRKKEVYDGIKVIIAMN